MAQLGEQLQGVLRLADQLEVSAVVEAICQHLESSGGNSMEQLIPLVAITERLHLSNTWAALVLKLAHVLLQKEYSREAAVSGPSLLQVKDQLSPAAWATLMACLLPSAAYLNHGGYGRSKMPSQEQVAGWLYAYGMGTPKKRPSITDDDKSTKKKKK
ncbi:hypothetical protein N2152v2_005561 [Parachlorella kessleri]